MQYLMGIDLGTSTIKAVLLDPHSGRVARVHSQPTPTSHPRPDWSEHDAEDVWQAVVSCIRECAAGSSVRALAVSSMAETTVVLDRHGQPLAPMIAWFDRRSERQSAEIEQSISAETLYRITGQKASPSFTATKLLWLRDQQPETFQAAESWLPVSSWVLYRLCGVKAVERSIASRTLLYDQHTGDWSDDLLTALRLLRAPLPPVFSGAEAVGSVTTEAAAATGLSTETVCVLGGQDHLCAAFAVGAVQPGILVDSTGSANALVTLVPHFLNQPALREGGYACYAHVLRDAFVLKGGLKAAGSAISWLVNLLAGGDHGYAQLEEGARAGAGSKVGPLWLPHFLGSGTPQGDRFSRAALLGVQIEDTPADLFRALLEGLALWTRHNLDVMQAATSRPLDSLVLTGGSTRLTLLSTLKAAAAQKTVLVPQLPEAAGVGAALQAGLGAGVYPDPATAQSTLDYSTETFLPDPQLSAWYDRLYQEVYLPLYPALQPGALAMQKITPA